MRLASLPGTVHLTYCTNIHAGESWDEIRASLDEYLPVIKAQVAADQPFGIGLRLSGKAAESLLAPGTLAAFQAQLARLGAYVFTINAFPYGPFHAVRVKQQVYLPDWRDDQRLAYTRNCARILAQLLPDGMSGSISTVPGAFKTGTGSAGPRAQMAANMLAAVAELVQIERDSGKCITLALEAEPCCFLETVDETLAFFADYLFAPDSCANLARQCGVSQDQAAALPRRHIGVCYDVCHAAVEFEDPLASLARLRAAGIAIAKIQLSSALRIPRMQPGLLAALQRFDDGVYLHQVVVQSHQSGQASAIQSGTIPAPAPLQRFADLTDACAAFAQGTAEGEWRIHCHVPVFLDDLGDFAATGFELRTLLQALRTDCISSHLEVETYTWDVLPPSLKSGSKADAIARELAFVIKELQA